MPKLASTLRACGSDGPAVIAPLKKRVSQISIECANSFGSLLPADAVSHDGLLSSTMPLQSSSLPLPPISIAPGFIDGSQSLQSPIAGV